MKIPLAALCGLLLPLLACSQGAPNQGSLCAGEAAPAELVPVAWPAGLYLPRPGVEHHADVLSVDEDGKAELLITGMDDEGAGHPRAITVVAPCAAWAGPGALLRPGGIVWAWPEGGPARVGTFAGKTSKGLIRVSVFAPPVEALTLPERPAPPAYPAWVLDPSSPSSSAMLAWSKACRLP